jgi:O-antigen/teichoic acid export membrane protein
VIIGWLDTSDPQQVAWIAAPVRIVLGLHTFVWLSFFNLLPNLARELHDGLVGWRTLMGRSLGLALSAGGLVAVAGTLSGPVMMTTVFGSAYAEAGLPFQIAVWMIPVASLSGHFRFSLIAAGRQDLEFRASLIGVATTLGLAVAGSHFWGAPGAAAALVAGGVANTVAAGFWMASAIGGLDVRPAARPVSAAAIAVAIGLIAGAAINPLIVALLGCASYLALTAPVWRFGRP